MTFNQKIGEWHAHAFMPQVPFNVNIKSAKLTFQLISNLPWVRFFCSKLRQRWAECNLLLFFSNITHPYVMSPFVIILLPFCSLAKLFSFFSSKFKAKVRQTAYRLSNIACHFPCWTQWRRGLWEKSRCQLPRITRAVPCTPGRLRDLR